MPTVTQTGPPLKESNNHEYRVSNHNTSRITRGSLVDRGANGGIIGNDARITLQHQRTVDVRGIDNHELNSLKIVDAAAKITTHLGAAIVILRQYAYHGLGRTIHSAAQFEHYGNKVDDRSMKTGGRQCIRTQDGYVIPLDIINGLPYMKMYPHTDTEWHELPHIILTSGATWDPQVMDHTLTTQDDWYNTIKDLDDGLMQTPFDQFGNYRKRHVPAPVTLVPPLEATCTDLRTCYQQTSNLNTIFLVLETETEANTVPIEVKKKPLDYQQYRPYFLQVPVEKIRRTFDSTTQHATNVMSGHNIQQTIQSPYPAHNVWRRNEPVASDTIFAEVPAIDTNGQTMAQIYVGRKSLVIDIFGMSTEKEFVNTLEDIIRKRGAMDKLITDSARVEISRRVRDILRSLIIDDWQSEANYQHQNFAEHRWRHFKRNIQWYMNWRNVDANAWLLCAKWIADVMNHTAEKSLDWRPPLQVLTGQTIDISIMLCFLFWDVVYCTRYKDKKYRGQIGSDKSSEIRGRFVGFAWDVGHVLTFKILTDDTKKVICRSRLRLSKEGINNLKLDTEAGAVPHRIYIHSKRDGDDNVILPTIDMSSNPFDIDDGIPLDDPPDSGESTNPVPPEPGESTKTRTDPIRFKQGESRKKTTPHVRVETITEDDDE